MPFTIRRGTNISEWLSQSERRGVERATFFTEADARLIARLGFDHIRLPIEEEQMWDAQGNPDREAFALLDAALDWCDATGLRAIVDLHILRTHRSVGEEEQALFTDPAEAARLVGLWESLSAHLGARPTDRLAYELLNEPVARDPQDWNRVAMAVFHSLRRREPERTLILGSNWYNQVQTFDDLEIPQGDEHLMLTFHYYRPMLITHYTAPWWRAGGWYSGPVHYPGVVIDEADLQSVPPEKRTALLEENSGVWERARILAEWSKPIAASRRNGYPLYCGEWGAYVNCPQELRTAWYTDMLALFDDMRIAWANWDYKGGFAPLVCDGEPTELAEMLSQS